VKVSLATCPDYARPGLDPAVHELLRSALDTEVSGCRVLVKPNFITRQNSSLSCTHPAVIRAVCSFFLQSGNEVLIGDSPAFGTARSVASSLNLESYLQGMPVKVTSFTRGRFKPLPWGQGLLLAEEALQADLIVNLPKLKAHKQMRISGAVKNLFGCVIGLRKALIHARYGDKGHHFEQALVSIPGHLQTILTLVDGIRTMQSTGPTHGRPYDFKLLASGANPVAVDTALYSLLGLTPEQVPLWRESCRQNLPGARLSELDFAGLKPEDFRPHDFQVPERLAPVSFHPLQLVKSSVKRIISSFQRPGRPKKT
jgi:uncharacterized protein (DUF362 family)